MKKYGVFFLTFLSLLLLFCFCSADDGYRSGNYIYRLLPDGSAEILDYSGEDTVLLIPQELDGIKVTSIFDSAFAYNETLKNVVIPEGIISIGDHAFVECVSIETIVLPESLIWLGNGAFQGCVLLEKAELPAGIVHIGWNPFDRCDSLSLIELSEKNNYYSVQNGVLYDLQEYKLITYPAGLNGATYTIPDWIVSIELAAFSENGALQEVTIPDSVSEMAGNPFCGCISLRKMNISSHNLFYEVKNGSLYYKLSNELIAYLWGKNDDTYKVSSGTYSIAQEAFYKHKELNQIELPKSIVKIGQAAFAESGLISIKLPDAIQTLEDSTFSGCENLTEVLLPSKLTAIGNQVFYRCSRLRHIELPGSLRFIGNSAFCLCESLVQLMIPNRVEAIGPYGFAGCYSLRSVSLPKSLFFIGQNAFLKAEKIKLTVDRNSFAEEWAEENGVDYQYRSIRQVPSDSI